MTYIPLDYEPDPLFLSMSTLIILIISTALGLLLFLVISKLDGWGGGEKTAALILGPFVGILIGLLIAFMSWLMQTGPTTEERTARQAQWSEVIESTYGIDLSESQMDELEPPEKKPGTDPTVFGETLVAIDEKLVTIQLAWDGTQIIIIDGAGHVLPTASG